jgi:hypothetical protein
MYIVFYLNNITAKHNSILTQQYVGAITEMHKTGEQWEF